MRNKIKKKRRVCKDCEQKDPEGYMVKDEIWISCTKDRSILLCLDCLQKRLGRELTYEDFDPWIQVNRLNKSVRALLGFGHLGQEERNKR